MFIAHSLVYATVEGLGKQHDEYRLRHTYSESRRRDPTMRPELAAPFVAPFVAGLFGLVPLMVQIATARAQRRDRMTRLNQLQAELEFLERLHALEGKVGAQDETAAPRTDLAMSEPCDHASNIGPGSPLIDLAITCGAKRPRVHYLVGRHVLGSLGYPVQPADHGGESR